ncbi:MAG: hypothetical protein Kow0098_26630 [Ignavibacteriaceae bacterium]
MKKQTISIKDLSIIENELTSSDAGVIAFSDEDENVRQIAINYIYKDKNIFFFLFSSDDVQEKIRFGSRVCFTVFKAGRADGTSASGQKDYHTIFSVSLYGILKEVDDEKLVNEVLIGFGKKYFEDASLLQRKTFSGGKVVMIDSEEIQAVEEII